MAKTIIVGFVAGALAVLAFHQGIAWLMYNYGNQIPAVVNIFGRAGPAYDMTGVAVAGIPNFFVPRLVSLAFWGGIWGIVLGAVLRRYDLPDLLTGLLFGALVCTVFGFTVVAFLKGQAFFAGGNKLIWWRAGLYNGAWGFGTALLMRPMALRG